VHIKSLHIIIIIIEEILPLFFLHLCNSNCAKKVDSGNSDWCVEQYEMLESQLPKRQWTTSRIAWQSTWVAFDMRRTRRLWRRSRPLVSLASPRRSPTTTRYSMNITSTGILEFSDRYVIWYMI